MAIDVHAIEKWPCDVEGLKHKVEVTRKRLEAKK